MSKSKNTTRVGEPCRSMTKTFCLKCFYKSLQDKIFSQQNFWIDISLSEKIDTKPILCNLKLNCEQMHQLCKAMAFLAICAVGEPKFHSGNEKKERRKLISRKKCVH